MRIGTGKIIEIQQPDKGHRQALIELNGVPRPAPGQYLTAHHPDERDEPTGMTLFPGGLRTEDFPKKQILTVPGMPSNWQPGDQLAMRGPLGKGFHLPLGTGRLALCAFGNHSDHLLPLAGEILSQGGEVALFTDGDFSQLPARVEVNRLEDLADACRWADRMACAIPLEKINRSLEYLGGLAPVRCPTQVLIYDQFPCAGLAECGVCAFRTTRSPAKLACMHGPVFDWQELA